MKRIACIALITFLIIPFTSNAETIDVHIKGVDDGVKTTKQQDYKEAVLFAKREAIERAGVKVKTLTTSKDFVVHSDYIESQAGAVLLPGYNVIDVGYQKDGTYVVILIGKVKTSTSDSISKEIGPDVRFIIKSNGVILDKKTGLEWYAGPDQDTSWWKTKSWIESLAVEGGGWRLPTMAELRGLYQKDVGIGKYNIDPLFELYTCCVWSNKTEGSDIAWGFGYNLKGYPTREPKSWSRGRRAFAVRSRR